MFKKKKKIKGMIAHHRLTDWWLNELSEDERKTLKEIYSPMVMGSEDPKAYLVDKDMGDSEKPPIKFLQGLLTWLHKPEHYNIAKKVIEKAEDDIENGDILDKHFLLDQEVQIFYRNREIVEGAFDKAVDACKRQIDIATEAAKAFKKEMPGQELPRHRGFDQLRIIRKKQKDYESVIEICREAKRQGWNGNWDKEIERAEKKI